MTVKLAHLTTVDLSLRYLVLPQLEAGVAAGWDTLGISAPGPDVPFLTERGIRHVPLPSSTRGWALRSDLAAARDLWRILRSERVDILHTHNPKPGLYGRILGRLAGVPIVINTIHGLYATAEDRWAKRLVVYLLEAAASRFSDAELVQSPEDADLMRRLRIAPPHRTFVLGNGVDLTRFDPDRFSADRVAEIRRGLGIEPGQIVVGAVGRLVAEKGYLELVDAAQRLDERFVVLAIGPPDPEKSDALGSSFEEDAARAGVRLLGMRTDVDELYAAMDMFVLASHREGFPRAAMEAAASGLPVIATDIRGCREVVVDGSNGLLIPVGDAGALATAIRRLGDDESLRRTMGEQGRRRAVERFDERNVVEAVFATYRGVALRKGEIAIARGAALGASVSIRAALDRDVPFLARLHVDAIDSGFLATLGPGFMERLYSSMLQRPDAVVLVADAGRGPVGFVAGVGDVAALYRHFVRHQGVGAGLAAAPKLIRPAILRRAWETLRYDADHSGVTAELLAMAVAPEARRRGIAELLGRAFLAAMEQQNTVPVRVVVGAGNDAAVGAYRKMGFGEVGTIEVHAGERSEVLVWSPEH